MNKGRGKQVIIMKRERERRVEKKGWKLREWEGGRKIEREGGKLREGGKSRERERGRN